MELAESLFRCVLKRARVLLRNAMQFSLVTDASTHSNKEVVVNLYHVDDHSMMVPIAICNQGQINVTDVDLPSFSQLSDIAKKQKIERESAYHCIKAISNELDVLTSGRVNIATFKIDGDTFSSRLPSQVNIVRGEVNKATFKIMTPKLHTHVLMLQMATRPSGPGGAQDI